MKLLFRFIPTNFEALPVWNRQNELSKIYSYKKYIIDNLSFGTDRLPDTIKKKININHIGDNFDKSYVYDSNVDYKDILKGWLFDFEREYKYYLEKTQLS